LLLRVLGPLEVSGSRGPVAIGAAKPRALLAALAVHRGQAVMTDVLIDALWGEGPPSSASKLLQVYVSQLRKTLPTGVVIGTTPTGYRLDVDPDETDADRFERLLADGRKALASGNPALASSVLGRALALWRGPAYSDVRYEEFARDEIDRLEGLRTLALEERAEADLRLGRHAQIVGELRGRLASDPTNERLAGQAILAAYRTAGTADALAIFETVRAAIAAELGEEPGIVLRELRDRITQGDASLDVAEAPDHRSTLPTAPNALIGREHELTALRTLMARRDVRFISLTGAGGSGKSRLALELAHELEPEFANGAIFVELASLSDPALVLPTIAQAVGLEPGRDAMRTLIEALAARELLLVVDNLEHLREAAPPLVRLLSASPRLALVVTTRAVLHVSGEHVFPVGPMVEIDAVALFAQRARAHDPTFVLDDTTEPQVAAICRRLDGLPLPIELAAARVRGLGLRMLDDRLASRLSVLTGGPRDLPARQQTLRETLAWSVNLLETREAEVLAALAVFPAGCSMTGAQAVARATDEDMITLVDHHLVQANDADGERRYRLLEMVREYGYELLGPRREEVEDAHAAYFASLAEGAPTRGAEQARGIALLDLELDNLRAAMDHASETGDAVLRRRLAAALWRYWQVRGLLAEGRSRLAATIADGPAVAPELYGSVLFGAGIVAWALGEYGEGRRLANELLASAATSGSVTDAFAGNRILASIALRERDFDASERHSLRSIELAHHLGDEIDITTTELNHAVLLLDMGQIETAVTWLEAVLDRYRAAGVGEGVGLALLNLGEADYLLGNDERAGLRFEEARAAFEAVGFRAHVGHALQGLAAVDARRGNATAAAQLLGKAAAVLAEVGASRDDFNPQMVSQAEADARERLGDEVFEQLFREGASGSD
jgi:predicted ATPase/DNA-binding SARP family transcriptional activator